MTVTETSLPDVLVVEPRVFEDDRGWFTEVWNDDRYREAGITGPFVQDNVSFSKHGVLRGLHFQNPRAQGKLVTVLSGEVFDVAVDVRAGSPTFGAWVGETLAGGTGRQLWVPPGFAHGFVVTGDHAVFSYKCTDVYAPEAEASVRWNDPAIGIAWPIEGPTVAAKDATAPLLNDIMVDRLRFDIAVNPEHS